MDDLKHTFLCTFSSFLLLSEAAVFSLPCVDFLHWCCWSHALLSQPRPCSICFQPFFPSWLLLLRWEACSKVLRSEKFLPQPFIPLQLLPSHCQSHAPQKNHLRLLSALPRSSPFSHSNQLRPSLLTGTALGTLSTDHSVNSAMDRILLPFWAQSLSRSWRLQMLFISQVCFSLPPFPYKISKSVLSPTHLFKSPCT